MRSLVELCECLLLDCGRLGGAQVTKDCEVLRHRVKHEGDSFITITLPAYCRALEQALACGGIGPGSFAGFAPRRKRSLIPAFLQGLMSNVFDDSGLLLENPCVNCIRALRQFLLFGKKILRECTPARKEKATQAYLKCEDEVLSVAPDTQLWRYFERVAQILCDDAFKLFGQEIDHIMPKHGPGAVQERISGNQKWRFRTWHSRLEEAGLSYFRYVRSLPPHFPNGLPWELKALMVRDEDSIPTLVAPSDEPPVRVVFVPKTQTTPRVIAIEPLCMQFVQQGLSRYLVRKFETSSLTRGHVNFTDQGVNQSLAKLSSQLGHLATLDMKEASDRVSLVHVESFFKSVPHLLAKVLACRSSRAELPNGDIVTLRKFASMGSALTFPVEAIIFFAGIIASRCLRKREFPSRTLVHSLGREVYVYGDDLVVPADEAPAIALDLEALGFKANLHKSFWTGQFRESCGMDCFAGEEITPVYLRRDLPCDRADVAGLLSAVSTCNQLSRGGYWKTATAIKEVVERILGHLPEVPAESPAIGWDFFSEKEAPSRWNHELQRWEHLHFVVELPKDADALDGVGALAKWYRVAGSKDLSPDHLLRSVRPYGLTIKRRWVST